MKRIAELDYKTVSSIKGTRTRNKRKCKRKKNARAAKRFCCVSTPELQSAKDHRSAEESGAAAIDPPQASGSVSAQKRSFTRCATPAAPSHVQLKNAQNVWIRAYQRIVKWHSKHQMNYWKLCAQQLKAENARLRRQAAAPATRRYVGPDATSGSEEEYPDKDDPYGDTEDESADDWNAIEANGRTADGRSIDEPEWDEEFLAFMEVSARHRLEHSRLKNESVH
ncbi:uncharacterized protein LOC131210883 [Anopheles bellator]|uniref:uncharacterized protein LOC131210883 n=1 Tax=Anopheles bellator TaxID=139047 RepID=UPI002647D499|nr:uncharacterized protein LOC131210883 [Anopheles bellator]